MSKGTRGMTTRRHLVVLGLGGALTLGLAGCKSAPSTAPIVGSDNSQDPAAANVAQPYTGGSTGGYSGQPAGATNTRVLSSSQSYSPQASGETYGYDQQAPAPVIRQNPSDGGQGAYDQGYSDAEEAGEEAIAATDQAPPPLPEYDQPPAPEPNDLWTPGYWNYAQTGYYWVPGAWVAPPFYGALWTPPYWGWGSNQWMFHRGYWGPHVGFYGGIDYGFGYVGRGYYGGYWRGRDFVYNRSVTNVNINTIHNVYTYPVVVDGRQYGPRPLNRVAYNGGRGGLSVQPTPGELAAAHEPHYPPVAAQQDLRLQAASNRSQSFSANGGRPAVAFAARPVGNPQAIAAAPHEQPFNRGGAANSVTGPNRAAPSANAAHAGLPPGQPNATPARGPAERTAPAVNGAHGVVNSNQPNFGQNRTSAAVPQGRSEAQPQHPATAVQHSPAPVQRAAPAAAHPAAPIQRAPAPQPTAHPAPEARPEAAPVARPKPEARPEAEPAAHPAAPARSAPAPRAAPAPHEGGDHGGHR